MPELSNQSGNSARFGAEGGLVSSERPERKATGVEREVGPRTTRIRVEREVEPRTTRIRVKASPAIFLKSYPKGGRLRKPFIIISYRLCNR